MGNGKFAATFRKNGRAPCGSMGDRPLQTECVFASVRSCLHVRPAGRTGSSAPTGACAFASVHANLQPCTAREGQSPSPTQIWWLCANAPNPAPREIPRRGRNPFLVGQRIAKGRSKLPLAVFLYTASGAFFPHGKKGGLSPHRCTAPCKSAKRGDTIQTRNRRAGQAPPLRYDETRYSSKTTASDPFSQLR